MLYVLLCVSQARDPGCSYNAIFAYAAAAIAQVFLHVALNCLKSQEIYSRDWKFSLLRKCSTKWINCFRKHIAGVGFWKLWLVGWFPGAILAFKVFIKQCRSVISEEWNRFWNLCDFLVL